MIPQDLRYHKQHEWVRVTGRQAVIGITDYAQQALGDIVFFELPKVGIKVSAGHEIGVVESTKTMSSIYTPVTGTVFKANPALIDNPEIVNEDPYGKGWIAVIEMQDPAEIDALLDANAYEAFLKSEST